MPVWIPCQACLLKAFEVIDTLVTQRARTGVRRDPVDLRGIFPSGDPDGQRDPHGEESDCPQFLDKKSRSF